MNKSNQKVLQVLLNGNWEYVFCYNANDAKAITTQNRAKALPAEAKTYFERIDGNNKYRAN